jgi:hypothetical protein
MTGMLMALPCAFNSPSTLGAGVITPRLSGDTRPAPLEHVDFVQGVQPFNGEKRVLARLALFC